MNSIVIYASHSGNTKCIAEEIARALADRGPVEIHEVTEAPGVLDRFDLVVVGGPTEGHGMTADMKGYLQRIYRMALDGTHAAAFDTRLGWPKLLAGSAAEGIARELHDRGAILILAPQSFIVSRAPELEAGELERAGRWAHEVARYARPKPLVATAV
jgi:flavodoxin